MTEPKTPETITHEILRPFVGLYADTLEELFCRINNAITKERERAEKAEAECFRLRTRSSIDGGELILKLQDAEAKLKEAEEIGRRQAWDDMAYYCKSEMRSIAGTKPQDIVGDPYKTARYDAMGALLNHIQTAVKRATEKDAR